MNRRPLALTIYSVVLILIAFSIPIQTGFLQDFSQLAQNLTWLNVVVMGLCCTLAWVSLRAHWSLRILLPLTAATVLFNNWWVGHVGLDFSMTQASFASFGFMALNGILMEKNTLQVLKNPRLKWWDRSPRNQLEVPVVLSPWLRGPTLHKKSFDLSETGLFIQGLQPQELMSLKLGERFQIRLHIEGHSEIYCTAKLIRKTDGAGVYPAGAGMIFEGLSAVEKQSLKKISSAPALDTFL